MLLKTNDTFVVAEDYSTVIPTVASVKYLPRLRRFSKNPK